MFSLKKLICEWCSTCEQEVYIEKYKASKCPNCNTRILPCCMCDCDIVDCNNCKYEGEL